MRIKQVSWMTMVSVFVAAWPGPSLAQTPLDDEISYQGLLTQGGTPFTGTATVEFRLFDVDSGGTALASDNFGSQSISDGLLSFCVDFGPDRFDGHERWIELVIDGTALSPRPAVCSTPYALQAKAAFALDAADGSPTDAVFVDNAGNVGIGTTNPTQALEVLGQVKVRNAFSQEWTGALTYVNDTGYMFIGPESGTSLNGACMTIAGPLDTLTAVPGGIRFNTTEAPGPAMVINSNGNVGIGTAAPSRPLEIAVSDNGSALDIDARHPTEPYAAINLKNQGVTKWQFGKANDDDFYIMEAVAGTSVRRVTVEPDSGNVGIGTASPEELLHVGNGTAGETIQIGAYTAIGEQHSSGATVIGDNAKPADSPEQGMVYMQPHPSYGARAIRMHFLEGITFHAQPGSVVAGDPFANETMRITNSGNLGIGTTAPAAKLHVAGTAQMTGFKLTTGEGSGKVLVSDGSGTGTWQTNNSLDAADGSPIESVFVDNDGDVGIGTSSPAAKLSVVEPDESTTQTTFTQALTNAAINIVTEFTNNAYTPGVFWSTSNNNSTKPKAGIYLRETTSGTTMLLGTSNNLATGITNDGVVIDPSGKVGIGTQTPADPLDVDGAIAVSGSRVIDATGQWVGDTTGFSQWTTSGSDIYYNSGNVGIGSTNPPAESLHVVDAASSTVRLDRTGGSSASFSAQGTFAHVGTTNNFSFRLLTNNLTRMLIDTVGNVGIGTATPAQRLDVAGSVAINGTTVINAAGDWVGNPAGLQGPPGPPVDTVAMCGGSSSGCGNCANGWVRVTSTCASGNGPCEAVGSAGSCERTLQNPGYCWVCAIDLNPARGTDDAPASEAQSGADDMSSESSDVGALDENS